MCGTDHLSAESSGSKKHTILIVDDNPTHLDVVVDCLSDVGFHVLVARDGKTGLEQAERTIPDLILLDIMLPGMDGLEVCRRLKTNEKTRKIMVVFMTALNETQEKIHGFSLGAVDYITKPFHQDEFLARVTILLRLQNFTDRLEQNVRQRTEALTTINRKLLQEINERKQIEEALRESEARYRAVIENSNDGIAILEAGHHVFVNQKLLEILAYHNREELIGEHVSMIFHPEDKERVARYYHLREQDRPVPSRYEAKGITRDGRTVYFDISAAKITYRERIAVLAFFRDITHRKQLQQAQKLEAIGTLTGGIAHDFNNILSAIIGHAELAVGNKHNSENVRNHLNQVLIAGKRAAQLVQLILTFSRQKDLERKPLEISPLINETIKMLRASLPPTIDIQCNIEDQCGMVMADPTQIHQVLMNLCTNAAHAMHGRSGLLQINLDKATVEGGLSIPLEPGIYLRISVEDNGHGMDRTTMDRIFDPYFSTKKSGEGTGLGLAVVQGIIASYGGGIEVESEPGIGTTFHILLPRIESVKNIEDQTFSIDDLPKGHERILFVDDEELVVSVCDDLLNDLGYRVVSTTNSEEALALFEKNVYNFDLVITDLTMPKLSGAELLKHLMRKRSDIPVIMCSGYGDRLSKEEVRFLGIRKYLIKPLLIDQLAYAVREVLDQR